MRKIVGIVKKDHIEEFEVEADIMPNVLIGKNKGGHQHRERKSFAKAFMKAGCEVYWAVNDKWPRDLYITRNGLYIRDEDFTDIENGGMYIFGKDFALVSKSIEDKLNKELDQNEGIQRFFSGLNIHYIQNYQKPIYVEMGNSFKPYHLDLSIGHVPGSGELFIEDYQFKAGMESICNAAEAEELRLTIVNYDNPEKYNFFPLNFAVLEGEKPIVIADKQEGFASFLRDQGYFVINPSQINENCRNGFGGIRCSSNIAESTEVFDRLGIEYVPFSQKPTQ